MYRCGVLYNYNIIHLHVIYTTTCTCSKRKPTLLIVMCTHVCTYMIVLHIHNPNDREGFRQLQINRFDIILLWNKLHCTHMMYGSNHKTEKYMYSVYKTYMYH